MEENFKSVDHKYHILKKIGGGGFSEVYLVEGPGGESALKLLKDVSASGTQTALGEFKNEFAVLKNLNHPHIARILDFGYDDAIGRYYYTSEMITGSTIFDATEGLTVESVTDLIVQCLRALEYLHSFHIYHFDIKAANVLVVPDTTLTVKLIDFGLAGIDPRGRLIGTPSYMSPEIVNRETADWRADLYSLAVLWYFCLARFNPFRAKVPRETLQNQLRLVPPPPSTFNEEVPRWMDAIIMRLLEKNPVKRFSHTARVLREINRCATKKYPLETRETLVSYLPQEGELVGRKKELEQVRNELRELVEGDEKSKAVLVEGRLGIGKTRFAREFKYEAQLADIRVQMAHASDAESYAGWCEALGEHISDGEGLEVFILEDVEALAGEETAYQKFLGLVSRASRPSGDAKVLLMLSAGPTDDEQFTEALRSVIPTNIELANFTPAELTDYLASLTGLDQPPEQLVEGIYSRTDGNPLFVTEVLKALITGGGLFDEGGRWRMTVFEDVGIDFSKVDIPSTVEDLLLAGVKKLTKGERTVLEALAVTRKPSSGDQLKSYSGVKDPFPALRELVKQNIIERSEEHLFTFGNELMGHTLYSSIPLEQRMKYHDRIAAALEAEGAPFEGIAHHQSYGTDAAKALSSSLALGERYLKRGRGRKAVRYLERAESIIPGEDVEARVDVLLKKGEAFLIRRDYEQAEELFSQVEVLVKALPDTEQAAHRGVEALIRLGGTFMKLMAFSRARAVFTEAKVKLHTKVIDPIRELTVENFLGTVLMSEGRYREAKELFENTRVVWKQLAHEDRAHATNNDLGMVLLALREVDGAREAFKEDLSFAEEIDDDLLISRAHYNLAQLSVVEGNLDEAIIEYKECAEVCKRAENTELLLRAYNGLGNIYHLRGELDQSVGYYERGLALHERAGDMRGGAAINVNIGIIENARKNYDAALDALIPAVEMIKGLPDKSAIDWTALSRGFLELGDVYKNQGKLDEAAESLSQAYDIAVSHDSAAPQRFWILYTLAEVARERGDEKQIRSLVTQMRPIATTDDEKQKLHELTKEFSIDAASVSKVVSEPSVSAEKERKKEGERRSRRASPYEKVLEINKLINAERDLNYVLKTVIYYALELAGAESGAIILLDEEGELTVANHRNMDGREDEVAFSRTLARRVLEEGKPVVTDDALADDRFTNEESIAIHQLKSIMCLPIRAKGRVIGVLYLDHRFSPGAFNEVDMKLIDAFTDQVGLAIVNARLVEMLSQRKEALSAELSAASVRIEHYEEQLREREVSMLEKDYGAIATRSAAMRDTLRMLDKVSDTDLSVLLVGESGVGKELLARALHDHHAQRKKGRFVAINCGAISATLMESELFGYKAGAFTGANRDKKGFLEEAGGGTIFFDEIGELDPQLQVKLLRVLQEQEVIPVGATRPVKCDVRVVAATNRDVELMMKEGTFREDLYYRLCQVKVVIAPLKERTEDIPELAKQFIAEVAGERELSIHPRLMKRLIEYSWPGNVRELKNLIHVAVAMTDGDVIAMKSIPTTSAFAHYFTDGEKREPSMSISAPSVEPTPPPTGGAMIDASNAYDPGMSWRDYERDIIAKAYAAYDFHAATAATELGISAATMYKRVNEWNLKEKSNELFDAPFVYHKGFTLDDYRDRIFKVALDHAAGKPMQAIVNLGISQGYFYKVMKKLR